VNYNTWLVRNGFMSLKGQNNDPPPWRSFFDTRDLFANVDWARTKAYRPGTGLHLREPRGAREAGDGDARTGVRGGGAADQGGLEALVDPDTGEHPIARVFTRDEMYTGFDPNTIPDLRAANALNYRVSWQTSLGGVPPDLMEDNLKPWSGDHCSNDPELGERDPLREPQDQHGPLPDGGPDAHRAEGAGHDRPGGGGREALL
jgi:predicted AlkP superfamily phosphohydrolase/phosphomutase